MLPILLTLLACGSSEEEAAPEEHVAAVGGPAGTDVPLNAVPWVLFPTEDRSGSLPGRGTRPGLTERELKAIRLVDRTGRDVPVQRVLSTQVAGEVVHIVPNKPLDKDADYRIIVPGALSKSFRTGRSTDKKAPRGGGLRDWRWESNGCPTLTVRYAPVTDTSPVFWEVEAQRADRRDVFYYASGAMLAEAAHDAAPLELRGCAGGNFELPVAELLVRMRWVDIAGNATDWSPSVTVPADLAYGAGSVDGAVSAAK